MGNPCICYTGALSASAPRLHAANLDQLDLGTPAKSKRAKLQKQKNFCVQRGSSNQSKSRRRIPNTFVVHSSYVEHMIGPLADGGIKHSLAPWISSLATQITDGSQTILNHMTGHMMQGMPQTWMDQMLHRLAMAFEDSSQIASSSAAISAAAIFIAFTGSTIALQSSKSRGFPLSLSTLNTLKDGLLKLQIKWSTIAKEHAQINEEDSPPLQYDTQAISDYGSKRPFLVCSRAFFILFECSILAVNILMDNALGKADQNERLRASQLVNLVTRLGPTAVKVGQAFSIRPDLLPPTYLEELQKLQDSVPPFSSEEARLVVFEGLGHAVNDVFSEFSEEPIAAASLGQVYRARLRESGEAVAVKVQRPNALATVCLDLYIVRAFARGLQMLPSHNSSHLLSFVDHWANHFFQELDYSREAKNAEEFSKNMRSLSNVVVPKPITQYTSHKVLTTSWVEGEKLSESKEADVPQLVSVALNCYLMQLFESGFLHADPHPGNLVRTPDGRLCILDFGLMIQVTEEQQYALIDYISHLVNSDYEKVADDLIKMGFLPPHLVDTESATEILPQLSRVLGQLVQGGGLQQMDAEQIIADLAQMAADHSIVIPTYFATILGAFSILEGIGLKTNPNYAIIDECYPYICKRLLTDDSPRARTALKYFLCGKKPQLDVQRVEAILLGFQNFRKTMVPTNGTRNLRPVARIKDPTSQQLLGSLFAPEGSFLQELVLAELVRVVDAISREAIFDLWSTFVGVALPLSRFVPPPLSLPIIGFFGASPMVTLSEEDQEALTLVKRLARLLGSETNRQTVAEMTAATHSVSRVLFPEFAAGVATASTRFWVMLLHRKALRFADDLDGRNSLVYWNRDPAVSARHVRPLAFLPLPPPPPQH